ncbi:O-antigen ligase family protein [Rhodococcus sp. BP22]|uniref:O-antigen ligase family protein n=1 Tax=Rhodococcus sp. BP22 TaxID=2758566 RepID=UPI0016479471|nr:O-antigen ligase family protein [Rhodococcus sp. BP22]
MASASLPSLFETEWKVELPVGSVYLADIFLVIAVALAFRYLRNTPGSAVLFYCAIISIAIGVVAGASPSWIVRDGRPFFYLLAGLVIGAYSIQNTRALIFGIRLMIGLIAVTALLAIASQLGQLSIVGTERGAENAIYYNGQARYLTAKRIQTEPVPVALLLLCLACSAWVLRVNLSRLIGRNWMWLGVASTLVLTTMAYSRNSLLGLATALLSALLLPASLARLDRLGRMLALVVGVSIFIGIPIWIGYQFGYFGNVIDSFSSRVIAGIAPDAIGSDPSVGWRFTETEAAVRFLIQNPLAGSGLGAFYRDRIASEPFRGDEGRLYLHNFYVLLFVKFGFVMGVMILSAIIGSVIRMIRAGKLAAGRADYWTVSACGFISMLMVSTVAPVVYSRSFAVVGGVMVALGLLSLANSGSETKANKGRLDQPESEKH